MGASEQATQIHTLAHAVGALSACGSMQEIAEVARKAARTLVGADGITVVVREERMVRYVDEDAIAPLWKGQAFPIAQCVSGLAMMGRETIVIDDIFADARVPHDFYRQTFVKSMAMAPVRVSDPVAAIGAYWATLRSPTDVEIASLEAMAQATAFAIDFMTMRAALAQHDPAAPARQGAAVAALQTPLAALRASHLDEAQSRLVDTLAEGMRDLERMVATA